MKINIILFIAIAVLAFGIVFVGFEYFDVVFLVNDMQSGLDYKDRQIQTLKKIFHSVPCQIDRSLISNNLRQEFNDSAIIKEFDNRIEVNEIVIMFNKHKDVEVMTLNEYTVSSR
jgi:hypothetical protein